MNKKSRREHLESLKREERTMIFHEAPHKLCATLDDLAATFGEDRRMALCRELTKLHEETRRCTIGEAIAHFRTTAPKGEFVLVVEGAAHRTSEEITLEQGVEMVQTLMEGGTRLKDAAKEVAEHTGLSKNELYNAVISTQSGEQ